MQIKRAQKATLKELKLLLGIDIDFDTLLMCNTNSIEYQTVLLHREAKARVKTYEQTNKRLMSKLDYLNY